VGGVDPIEDVVSPGNRLPSLIGVAGRQTVLLRPPRFAAIADVPVRQVCRILIHPCRNPCAAAHVPGLAGPLACAGTPWREAASGCGSGRGGTWTKGFITAAWLWAWTVMAGGCNAGPARADAVRVVLGRAGGQQPDLGMPAWAAQPCAGSAAVPAGCRWLFGA
jgi:hypothetical protein